MDIKETRPLPMLRRESGRGEDLTSTGRTLMIKEGNESIMKKEIERMLRSEASPMNSIRHLMNWLKSMSFNKKKKPAKNVENVEVNGILKPGNVEARKKGQLTEPKAKKVTFAADVDFTKVKKKKLRRKINLNNRFEH